MRELCRRFGVTNGDEHGASGDAKALADCLAVALAQPDHGLAQELRAVTETKPRALSARELEMLVCLN